MGCCPSCNILTETQQLRVTTLTTEYMEDGPGCICVGCCKTGQTLNGNVLNEKQYIVIKNVKSGTINVVRGPGLKFLSAFERLEGNVQDAIVLRPDEYIKIVNSKNGAIRVERGEKLAWLEPFEQPLTQVPEKVVVVDAVKAALIRNITTGVQMLITEPQTFVPNAVQEVVEIRNLVILKYFEAAVLVDPNGNFVFKHGWLKEEASFFVPPYHTMLRLRWTKTTAKKTGNKNLEFQTEEEQLTVIDVRHRFMTYSFVARTLDNVEIILDIVLGWSISSIEKMINKTKDTTNDICLKVRSEVIEKVARLTFRNFMQQVNATVESAVLQSDRSFYDDRGIQLSSIQVEGFGCKQAETEKILQETVQETTNKLNRILKQETANEVIRVEMEGKIREEELKKRVLEIQYDHEQLIARTDGEAASKRITSFLEALGKEVTLEDKLALFSLLEKKESIKDLANGVGVTLYCAPSDMNLNMTTFANFPGSTPAIMGERKPSTTGRRQ